MSQALAPVSSQVELLRSLLASSGDCIKILDCAGNLVFMTEGGQRIMEVQDFSAIKGCPWPDFWKGQGNLDAKAAIKTALAGGTSHFEGFATTVAGTPKWWDVTVSAILGGDGAVEAILSVSRDITASRTARLAREASEQRFEMFAQAMPNQVWSSTPDGLIDWVNQQACEYGGLGFDDILGTGWTRMVHPDDLGAAAAAWSKSLETGAPYQAQFRLRRHDGAWRLHLARAVAITNEAGTITRWVGTNTDIEDQRVVEADLRESEMRAAAAVAAADIGTWDFDPQAGVLTWDRRCYELFGLTPGKPISYPLFLEGLHPDDREITNKACVDAMSPDGTRSYDIEYRTIGFEDGVERWVSAKGRCEFEGRTAVRFIGTIRDISDLKRAEAQRNLLNFELEHRMKNTMAMVSAIAGQTFRTAKTLQEARPIFEGRLQALNHAHDILVRSSWTQALMMVVAQGALQPHRTGEGRITIGGPNVELTAKQALSLSLALHELATNATKYGALSVPGGTIDVRWDCPVTEEGVRLSFEWRERDGPAVVMPERRGFGSRLIERTLSADFGGSVQIDYDPRGLVCRFDTKWADVPAEAK